MKPRYPAALALVSWYLMRPPLPHLNPQPGTPTSLAHWIVVGSFPSQKECEAHEANSWDQCVASDDPRLKEK
jgi:hypothetical protein